MSMRVCHILFVVGTLCHFVTGIFASYSDIFATYCPYTEQCKRNASKFLVDKDREPCCLSCRCDSLCNLRNDCCPDTDVETSFSEVHPTCERAIFPSKGEDEVANAYLMWSDCPMTENSSLRSKCLGRETPEELVIVSDFRTGTIYRNRFCALCHNINNISNLVPWNVTLLCRSKPPVGYSLRSLESVFEFGVKQGRCKFRYKPPEGISFQAQRCRERKAITINTCLDKNTSDSKKKLCYNSNLLPLFVPERKRDYSYHPFANIFCAMCSISRFAFGKELCPLGLTIDHADQTGVFISFSAILNLDSLLQTAPKLADNNGIKNKCGRREIFDIYKLKCRELYCPMGYEARYGECRALYKATYQQLYGFILQVQNLSSAKEQRDMPDAQAFERALTQHAGVENSGNMGRFSFCSKLSFLAEYGSDHTVPGSAIFAYVIQLSQERLAGLSDILNDDGIVLQVANKSGYYELWKVALSPYEFDIQRWPKSCSIVQFNKCLYCRQLLLDPSELRFENQSVVLQISGTKLNNYEFILSDNGSVYVCVNDYFHLQNYNGPFAMVTDFNLKIKPSGIVSLVCTILSITCLLVVIGTYIAFADLRNAFGKSVLTLCFNILTAQVFFQFGAGQTDNAKACVVVGVLTHFWWLCVFSSKTVCMFFVYKMVSSPTNRTGDVSLPKLSLIQIYLPPALIVLLSSLFAFVWTNTIQFGYGGHICFLNTNLAFVLFFGVPLGITVVFNFILFTVIIVKVRSIQLDVTDIQQQKYYSSLYLRLTVFTGVTWLFALLYNFTTFVVFEYLFLVFNCSIGVLVFISFILKKRTCDLYMHFGISTIQILRG